MCFFFSLFPRLAFFHSRSLVSKCAIVRCYWHELIVCQNNSNTSNALTRCFDEHVNRFSISVSSFQIRFFSPQKSCVALQLKSNSLRQFPDYQMNFVLTHNGLLKPKNSFNDDSIIRMTIRFRLVLCSQAIDKKNSKLAEKQKEEYIRM